MKKVLVLAGANGNYNLGDDAMFEALVDYLQKEMDLYIITDCWPWWRSDIIQETIPYIHYSSKYRTIRKLITYWRYFIAGFTAHLSKRFSFLIIDQILLRYINTIKNVDIVVFAGMGGMNDNYVLSSHGIVSRGIVVKIAKVFKKPVVFAGNGIGPIRRWHLRFISSSYIKNVEKAFVRDKNGSKNALVSIGYPEQKIIETIDDVFFLKYSAEDKECIDQLLKEKNLENFVAINIHDWGKNKAALLIEMVSKTIGKELNNETLLLVPNCYGKFGDDRVILKELYRDLLRKGINCTMLEKQINAKQTKYLIGKAKYSISTRYHIGAFGLSQNKPSVLLCLDDGYYKQKMEGILGWYGIEEYAVEYDQTEDLDWKIKKMINKYGELTKTLRQKNIEIEQLGYLAGEYVIKKLKEK